MCGDRSAYGRNPSTDRDDLFSQGQQGPLVVIADEHFLLLHLNNIDQFWISLILKPLEELSNLAVVESLLVDHNRLGEDWDQNFLDITVGAGT